MDLLRHLRFFTAVAETRHFGHAAQDLEMTQPPLSQGIQRLERQIGVRLFDRDSRGVAITEAGRRLLPSARELVAAADAFVIAAHELGEPPPTRLGLCTDLGPLIGPCTAAVRADGPPIYPTVAGSTGLIDLLHEGRLDIALVRHPGVVDGLTAGEVIRLGTHVAAPAANRLPFVVPPRHHQPTAHDQFIDELRRAGHDGTVIETADPGMAQALVAGGQGVIAQPGPAARGAAVGPPLRVRTLTPPPRLRRPDCDYDSLCARLAESLRP